MKKKIIILISIILIIGVIIFLLPLIVIDKNNKIMYLSFKEDFSKYEEVTCYDDGMSYYKEKDITIKSINVEKKFIYYLITLEYVDGNLCASEFMMEENYMNKFLSSAEILSNEKNVDVKNLIEGKTPIIKNKRYNGNDYETSIEYKLDGRYETMYIFYQDDLLIIQVGLSDEGPKFIAYK